jgi:hypothetical protein
MTWGSMNKIIRYGVPFALAATLWAWAIMDTKKIASRDHGLGELVEISVKDERFYNSRNQKDECGNSLLTENVPEWGNLISDLNLVNPGKGSLADRVRDNGYIIKIPKKYVNKKYGCK